MFKLALWLLQQYHLTLNEQRMAQGIPIYGPLLRRSMTTALPPAPEWSQGESYGTILRHINGEPLVDSGYLPGPEDLAALHAADAPHEVSGVLRMLQTGTAGPEIARKLRKSPQQVVHELNLGIDDQGEAAGREMYNDRIQVCPNPLCGDAMHKAYGQSFRCPSDTRTIWNGTTNATGKP